MDAPLFSSNYRQPSTLGRLNGGSRWGRTGRCAEVTHNCLPRGCVAGLSISGWVAPAPPAGSAMCAPQGGLRTEDYGISIDFLTLLCLVDGTRKAWSVVCPASLVGMFEPGLSKKLRHQHAKIASREGRGGDEISDPAESKKLFERFGRSPRGMRHCAGEGCWAVERQLQRK